MPHVRESKASRPTPRLEYCFAAVVTSSGPGKVSLWEMVFVVALPVTAACDAGVLAFWVLCRFLKWMALVGMSAQLAALALLTLVQGYASFCLLADGNIPSRLESTRPHPLPRFLFLFLNDGQVSS